MNEYDRLVDILTDLVCKFCPVCAKRLKEVTAQSTITNSGAQNGTVSWRNKTCPDGHGSFGVDYRWDPHDGNPDAIFEANPELFLSEPIGKVVVEEDVRGLKMTFFEQLREVQSIVDEANKKED